MNSAPRTIATTAEDASTRRRALLRASIKPVVFTVLLALASMAGAIPIPGTPVPITLQTLVVMVAALTMSWRQVACSVLLYLAAGAVGLPVFAGGASTAALFGPSAGFLIGFLPGAIVTALLKGKAKQRLDASAAAHASETSLAAANAEAADNNRSGLVRYALTALRYFAAAIVGCVVVVYAFGFAVQSALTGVPLATVALISMGFVAGDLVKAVIASLTIAAAAVRR